MFTLTKVACRIKRGNEPFFTLVDEEKSLLKYIRFQSFKVRCVMKGDLLIICTLKSLIYKYCSIKCAGTLTYLIVAHEKPYLIIEHAGILKEKNKRTWKNLCNKRTCCQYLIKVVKIFNFCLIKTWKNYRKLPNKQTGGKKSQIVIQTC